MHFISNTKNLIAAATVLLSMAASGQTTSYVNDAPAKADPRFANASAVAADTDGNIYIADTGAGAIAVYDTSGMRLREIKNLTTSDGNFTLQKPTSICMDKANTLYVYDATLVKIFSIKTNGETIAMGNEGSGIGQIDDVKDIAVDSEGYIHVLNGSRKQIDVFAPDGQYVTWITGAGNSFDEPIAIGINGKNDLYVLDKKECSVFMFDIGGNLFNIHRTMARRKGVALTDVIDMTVLANGDFFILDEASGSATHFDRIGVVQGTVGTKGESAKAVFQDVHAITNSWCYGNAVVILDKSVNKAQLFKVISKAASMIPGNKRMKLTQRATSRDAIADMAVGINGNRFVIPYNQPDIVVAYRDTTNQEIFVIRGKFDEAKSLATDSLSNLYVIDGRSDEVVMFDNKGILVRKFGQKIPKKLKDPTGIAIQSNGNILVADNSTGNIHLWNSNADYQKIWIDTKTSDLPAPYKICTDSKDMVYVWDKEMNAIARIAASGWPVALKQLKVRGERAGDSPGTIGDFFLDPLDQLHVYNQTTAQMEVYAWDLEPQLLFSVGRATNGVYDFEKVNNVSFDRYSFLTYFTQDDGKRQQVYQFELKPPTPPGGLTFDMADDGKLAVFFEKMKSPAVMAYGLSTSTMAGIDSLATQTNTGMLLLKESQTDSELHTYNLVSLSYTNMSDPGAAFENYIGHAERLMRDGLFEEGLVAWQNSLDKMGASKKMKEYISSKLCEGGRELAQRQQAMLSINYLKLAYSLTPNDEKTKLAYSNSFRAYFQHLVNREDYKEILMEVERLSANPTLKPMVLSAVDSVSVNMAQLPSEQAIANAIALQKKLLDWEPSNANYYGSLAASHYAQFKFKRNSALPVAEQQAALQEAERYGKLATDQLKKNKQPHYNMQLLLLKILNAQDKYIETESIAFSTLNENKMNKVLTADYRLQLAAAYTGLSKHNTATLEYQRVVTELPDNAQAKLLMAESLIAEKKYDQAKEIYQQLLLNDRNNAQYIGNIGQVELLKGNYAEASFQLEKAVKMNPADRNFCKPLAQAFAAAGNTQKAIENYRIAVRYGKEQLSKMMSGYSSAQEVEKEKNVLVTDMTMLAELMYQAGDFASAADVYREAVLLDVNNAAIHYGLGRACLSSGLVYDAVNAFAKAKSAEPANDTYKTAHNNALKLREQTSANEPPLKIVELTVKDIYPSLYKNYANAQQLQAGKVVISNNTSQPIIPQSVSVMVPELMTQPTEIKVPTLTGYSNTTIELAAIFTDKILSYTSDETMQMQVEVKYNSGGKEQVITKLQPFTLHSRNAISWRDKRCLAAFVSPSESSLIDYNKKADQIFKEEKTYGLNKNMLKALQLYTLLHQDNIVYSADPLLNFATVSTNTDILDFMQYPSETLKRKSGDCDDLVALYCSMLENAGISAAYVDVPGHVFAAFDINIKPDELVKTGLSTMDVIVADGRVWLPVETTLISNSGFVAAWASGAARYFSELDAGHFPEIVPLADARKVYAPSAYLPANFNEEPPQGSDVLNEYNSQLTQLTAKTKKEVVAEIAGRYLNEPDNVYIKNKYGMLLGQTGDLDKAERILQEALALSPANPSVLNNLGNLYYLKNNSPKAVEYYQKAFEQDEQDPEILINLCKAFLLAGDKAKAKLNFDKAVSLNTNLDILYSNLKQQLR
ncbi:MAG: tetratricopeptide repeat protein [Flavobacteriales bacterium]